jgi:hypothetical protein
MWAIRYKRLIVHDVKIREFLVGGKVYAPCFFGMPGQWVALKSVQRTCEKYRLAAGIFQV